MKGFAAMVLLVVLASTPRSEAVSCGHVQVILMPCLPYLTFGLGEPTSHCCSGVKTLQGSLHTQEERQTACDCMNSLGPLLHVKYDIAVKLPGKCGISAISPGTDCSRKRGGP